ncbi:MAG: 3-deoxy-D-manno-octulosonic acid transferase [Chitinophagaceae bacterium]|nr:3-deoxy-D-manno-octulosonic acid transferase [Chitinophagaceae bacterium]
MLFFYNLFIKFYAFAAFLLSFFNAKAKLWVEGRKQIIQKLQVAFTNNTHPVIWFHCASLGEFEQGRPLIEKLKIQYPKHKILITFFSPSGYEIQKEYQGADWIFYLPLDTVNNVKQFYEIVQPELIFFIKYEFWYHYIIEAKRRNIPLILVSGIFRMNQPFFKWYGSLHREMLSCFKHFFIQGQLSYNCLSIIYSKNNITICGDTRFDRVLEIAQTTYHNALIENFIGNDDVIVAGSTWRDDDLILDHFANTRAEIKFIIAPHEIHEERIEECLRYYKNAVLYSQLEHNTKKSNILIIDNVGMLNNLYRYATVTLVGGGFGGDGVHNVLEPAVFNKPVVIGPVYDKFREAVELVEQGGVLVVENALELEQLIGELLLKKDYAAAVGAIAGNYVRKNAGATDTIIDYVEANRLLTN